MIKKIRVRCWKRTIENVGRKKKKETAKQKVKHSLYTKVGELIGARVILFRYCSASCAADLNEVQIPRDKVQ